MKKRIVRTLHPERPQKFTRQVSDLRHRKATKRVKSLRSAPRQQNIAIIGSTGSVGRQTLDVIRENPKNFRVIALAALSNTEILLEQIKEFRPRLVALYKNGYSENFQKKLAQIPFHLRPKLFSGKAGLEKIAEHPSVKKIVFSSSGIASLSSLHCAIKKRKQIALANKELMVIDGENIMKQAKKNKVQIIPVDSEHSAIFQSIQGEDPKHIEKIILTCSGGPFYGKSKSELETVTVSEALKHPTWKMGSKIAIDCATLMNKGFEMVEAKHFFGLQDSQIEIMIHPQSVVHSLVVFKDGNIKAHLSVADMRIPIAYALMHPKRTTIKAPHLDLAQLQKLTFLKPDTTILQGPDITLKALKKGKKSLQKLVQKNEQAVQKFLAGKIKFLDIFKEIDSQ